MLQIYTGNGKGKTTASIGLALRAIGNNKKVYIIQFLKFLPTGEQIISNFKNIILKRFRF